MKNTFKNLVLASFVIYVVWLFLPYFDGELLSVETRGILSSSAYGAIVPPSNYIAYGFLAAYSLATVGLLRFKAWAKPMFITLTIASIVLTPLGGVGVSTSIEGLLSYLINLADGAIIAMLLFTEIRDEFSQNV